MKAPEKYPNWPPIVLYIKMNAACGIPIGSSIYEKAITEYPEFFPEETEKRKKWGLIPNEIHEDYWNEWNHEMAIINTKHPLRHQGKGIMFFIDNPKESAEWSEDFEKQKYIVNKMEKKLHDKYYKKYGL